MRERFLTTLTRNTLAAAALGFGFMAVLRRSDRFWWDYVDAFTLAFCFTLLGHYIEVILLKIPGIEVGAGRLIRIAGWFAGGLWCYVIGRFLWIRYGRDVSELPSLMWGGVFLVALELVIHAGLRVRGHPNFYSGQSSGGSSQ